MDSQDLRLTADNIKDNSIIVFVLLEGSVLIFEMTNIDMK